MTIIPLGFMVVELGMVVVTRRAASQIKKSDATGALLRHMTGDWGRTRSRGLTKE
jgi:hypothetical protein